MKGDDMTSNYETELDAIAARLRGFDRGGSQLATLGYFAGAVVALREAVRAGYLQRGTADQAEQDELGRVIDALLVPPGIPEARWMARFHFNSATHRIAALADRVVVAACAELEDNSQARRIVREWQLPSATVIYQFVNALKHKKPGGTKLKTPTVDAAILALRSALDLWENLPGTKKLGESHAP